MSNKERIESPVVTIGLRLNPETHKKMMQYVSKILPDLMEGHGLDINEGSTLIRLAISNLVTNLPKEINIQKVIFACRNDATFKMFFDRELSN
jgi:hypothetical protein